MTPQELKNSILQLAVQGRLVDQVESEGTGTELFKRIIGERKRLGIRENKKVEPITEEIIPFDIPSSWCWTRFGDIVTYNMGKTPPRAEIQWWEDEFPWVSIADMSENGHITSTKEGVSRRAIVEKFGNRISPAGTMIMSFKLTVGRVSILDIDAVHNEAIISIFPLCDSENCFQKYLFNILPTITQYGDSKNAIKGKTLNDTSISNLLIPLPPLAEQKRIVAKIEELLPLIERYEQAWTRLEDFNKRFPVDMQKSILQMAIQGKLVEQRPEDGTGEELYRRIQAEKQAIIKAGKIKKEKPLPEITEDEIPFEIPESWKWVRLSAVTDMLSGFAFKSEDFKTEGKYRLLRGINLGVNDVRWKETVYVDTVSDRVHDYKLAPGDVLLGLDRPWISDGTRVAIFDEEEETYLVQRVLRIKGLGGLTSPFIALLLRSSLLKDPLGGETTGISVPHISPNQVGNIAIPLPPLAEQKRIVAKLEQLLPLCEKLK